MLEGLQAILEKEAVLSTVNADDLMRDPQRTEGEYQKHVATFIPMGDVAAYSTQLVKRVTGRRTAKGMLVAPYGYGKTSTLAFLWNECERQDLVAVPPFYCATLLDILNATYGWLSFRLKYRQPDLLPRLDAAYKKYTVATVEEMASRYAQEHGLAEVVAESLFDRMLEDGALVLELTPANLLFFLDDVVELVLQAGYRGLVLLPDEIQQYFSRESSLRRTVQEFREFIWGLDTRTKALGVLFSVPTYAEAAIQEHGKDILHRLKKDDLYYRLQDIYSADFPARLWQCYVESFNLTQIADRVIDSHALRAIGQIAEREDLGEGPRTVIDSLKRAVLHYNDHGTLYTPLNLVDDFLESNIRFQAQSNKLKTVARQALESAIVDTAEKIQAVKLMAAFPRGCSVPVQKEYELHDAINALSKQAHGELMVHLAEGYTLLGLNRTEGPAHGVDMIITRFWRSYEEDELHMEGAIRAFIGRVLPRFFPERRGSTPTGWANLHFEPSGSGSQVALLEGSFNPRYPRRLLALQVAYTARQLQPLKEEADLQFDFLCELADYDKPGVLVLESERLMCFRLNLQQKLGSALPDDMRKLQDFVNPEFVTPLLMLSLIDYFDRWEEIDDQPVNESDRPEIEYLITRLVNHTIQVLFSREVAESLSPPLRRVGTQMFDELFNRRCTALYADYHTFFVHAQYESVLNDYANAMRAMTLKERRGHASLRGSKEALAQRFGVGSVATFENRVENEYVNLMRKVEWVGKGSQAIGEIELQLHPLESLILDRLRQSSSRRSLHRQSVPILTANDVAELARELGYRPEETLWALKLLTARAYTRIDNKSRIVYLNQIGPDPSELKTQLSRFQAEIETIPTMLLTADQSASIQQTLSALQLRLQEANEDEEELDELQARFSDLNQSLMDALSTRQKELQGKLNRLLLDLERAQISLRSGGDALEREIQGQVAFVMHLNELRQQLGRMRRQIAGSYASLNNDLKQSLDRIENDPVRKAVLLAQTLDKGEHLHSELQTRQERLDRQVEHLEHWIKLLRDTERLFNALAQLPELRKQLTQQIVPEIQVHFTKHKLDGLADWEPFEAKVAAVEEELEKRRRYGYERFSETKDRYEVFLREINVGDYRPRTRYTYGEDEESYRDLYEEVRVKVEGRLNEIARDLQRDQTDLLKVKYIHVVSQDQKTTVQQAEDQVKGAEKTLALLHRSLTTVLVQEAGPELDAFGEEVNRLSQSVETIRQTLGPVLFADHQLDAQEVSVLDAFDGRSDTDVTDLFVELRHAGQDIELDDLLGVLEQLYRKNRVMIRVRRRG